MATMFSRRRFLVRSLRHHRRVHAAVALGVAAATAVLCGALLVGDSVRGSLRHLVLDRFGRIDEVLAVDRFFRQELAAELIVGAAKSSDASASATGRYETVTPAVLLMGGTAEHAGKRGVRRATQVQILGSDAAFWDLGPPALRPHVLPSGDQVVVNRPLAAELGIAVGDRIVVRLPGANQVPADSPLGRKTDRVRSLAELTVVDIVPAEGLGRFSLRSSQQQPLNVYLPLDVVQRAVEQPDKVNALFAVAKAGEARTPDAVPVRSRLADLGLKISHVHREFGGPNGGATETVYDYFQLSSDRLLLDSEVVRIAPGSLERPPTAARPDLPGEHDRQSGRAGNRAPIPAFPTR